MRHDRLIELHARCGDTIPAVTVAVPPTTTVLSIRSWRMQRVTFEPGLTRSRFQEASIVKIVAGSLSRAEFRELVSTTELDDVVRRTAEDRYGRAH